MACPDCGYEGCSGDCDGDRKEGDQDWLRNHGHPTEDDEYRARIEEQDREEADDNPELRDDFVREHGYNPWDDD